jgi:uncharacterized protein YbjT (DUF2867 family)
MKITVIGANGKIGRLLLPKLVEAGHEVRGMVRDQAQLDRVRATGAQPVMGDLDDVFEPVLEGVEGIVFSAGSGGHTGPDRTMIIDLWGAIKVIRAAERLGAKRFVMVSSRRSRDPDAAPIGIRHYLIAKLIADEYLERSSLDYTIVCPGALTDEPGTGRVSAAEFLDVEQTSVPREDVAATIVACLQDPTTIGKQFDLLAGDTPIVEAVARV